MVHIQLIQKTLWKWSEIARKKFQIQNFFASGGTSRPGGPSRREPEPKYFKFHISKSTYWQKDFILKKNAVLYRQKTTTTKYMHEKKRREKKITACDTIECRGWVNFLEKRYSIRGGGDFAVEKKTPATQPSRSGRPSKIEFLAHTQKQYHNIPPATKWSRD